MAAKHTIHGGDHRHLSWDNSTPPAMTVAPGDVVRFDDLDGLKAQIARDVEAVADMPMEETAGEGSAVGQD
ncbi:MAG: hypothetical protein IIC73_02220 [Armatimonadetes bacterium]|nr:hypothetical protein [Armatimonadota bacterium]